MRKAEMLPSQYITGIIAFVLVMSSGLWMINAFRNTDSSFIDDTKYSAFNSTFDKYDDLDSTITTLDDSIQNAEPEFGVFGALNGLINTAWNGMKVVLSSLTFMNAVFGGLYTFFGLPAFIGNLIILAITVLLVFALIAALLQGRL